MSAAAPPAIHRGAPRVHAAWTADWFSGGADLHAAFGPAPSADAVRSVADRLVSRAGIDWEGLGAGWTAAAFGSERAPDPDAFVVLAGQQPCLAGGAALVAHKAASAIQLAHHLAIELQRKVVPVFLLATDDHDSSEIDHVDVIDSSNNRLRRHRCRVLPGHDAFWRSTWDEGALKQTLDDLGCSSVISGDLGFQKPTSLIAGHVARLLDVTFGPQGLVVVESHRLRRRAPEILDSLLESPDRASSCLRDGADALARAGLAASFDPGDPRPLVLESRQGRRRRIEAGDSSATERLRRRPEDFSGHAAARPLLQAASLPVVAQICGPSELRYLGQARSLHAWFGLQAPLLVPRLEATAVPADLLSAVGGDLAAIDARLDATGETETSRARLSLLGEAARFADAVSQGHGAPPRSDSERWIRRLERDSQRLVDRASWHGRRAPRMEIVLRPRSKPQDTVLAWLPEACRAPDPAAWGVRIVSLARPFDPPAHVLYSSAWSLPGHA